MKQLEHLWKNSDVQTKLKVTRSCIFSTATHGCESWCLFKTDMKRIDAFEMKCYSRALKISYTEHGRFDDLTIERSTAKSDKYCKKTQIEILERPSLKAKLKERGGEADHHAVGNRMFRNG
eukprot:GHVO01014639.1.p1 GENE.GHVO01014639.1~~GHVO01014639.1.p1  ORF type:complete len:121 (+),score=17.55 GHVO01014639.1:434-796(+)